MSDRQQSKEERLAAQLRTNLRRRKAHAGPRVAANGQERDLPKDGEGG